MKPFAWDAIFLTLRRFLFISAWVFGLPLAAAAQETPQTESETPGVSKPSEPGAAGGAEPPAADLPPVEIPQPKPKPKPVAAKPAKPKSPPRAASAKPRAPTPGAAQAAGTASPATGVAGLSLAQAIELGKGLYSPGGYLAATGPVKGYVAQTSATATKTGTPIIDIPQSISVITADQMRAQAVENLAQAVRYTPGITGEAFGLDNRGYGLQIRGFGDDSDSMFYKDGLQLRGTGFAGFADLDPYGAERIEVLRGPTSVLYGLGEPGGIINYISKRPTLQPFHEVEVGIGNFNHYEGKFDLSDKITADGKFSYRLTGIVTDSDTQIDYVDYDRYFIAPAFTWRPDADTILTVLTNYQYHDTGWAIQFYPAQGTELFNPNGRIPSHRFTGEPNFDYYKTEQYQAGYLFEHRFNDVWTIRQNGRYQHLDNSQRSVYANGLEADLRTLDRSGDGGESDLGAWVMDTQLQGKFATGRLAHTLLAGFDYQHYNFNDRGMFFDNPFGPLTIDIFNPVYGAPLVFIEDYQDTNQKQQQLGFYLQDEIKLFERWHLLLGGRHDRVTTDTLDRLFGTDQTQKDDAYTGRTGLSYHMYSGLAPYANYTQSFLPTLGTDVNGRPFESGTGEQFEVGAKYQPPAYKNLLFTFAAFDLTRGNVLTIDPNNPLNQLQTGEINSRGIELEAVASFDSGLNLRAAYTFLDVEITQSNDGTVGNVPYGVPAHTASAWADYTIQSGRFAGLGYGGGVRFIGESWGDDANSFKVAAVTLVDATLHYDWRQYRLAINAQNLFDKEYVASCFDLSGCFYGERRQVLGTLRYRW